MNQAYRNKRQAIITRILGKISNDPRLATCARDLADYLETTPAWIDYWVEEARMDGHLVLENEDGYYLAPSYDLFDQWRKDNIIPKLTRMLDMLQAMGKTAKDKFHRDQDDSVLRFVTG